MVSICEEYSGSEEDENEVIQNEDEIVILKSDEEKGSSQNSDASYGTDVAVDRTTWTKLEVNRSICRYPIHKIFKNIAGPTGHGKKNLMEVNSAFHLIITKNTIEQIKSCNAEEACRVLKGGWKLSTTKLLAFSGILYARRAYEANSLSAFYLSSKEWEPAFFSKGMPRDKFMQILRFVRLDKPKKMERSKRLRTDKFTSRHSRPNDSQIYHQNSIFSIASPGVHQHFKFSDTKRMDFLHRMCGVKIIQIEISISFGQTIHKRRNEKTQNIDYNHPSSPSNLEERKTCQIGFCKKAITPVKYMKRLLAESVQTKLSICVKDARNKYRILK
uniref:Uncharacterized protein n=1 Tax=Glossina palpalis gambiensis TaxID=67801 RepID=A0A1B0BLL8_9MUSC